MSAPPSELDPPHFGSSAASPDVQGVISCDALIIGAGPVGLFTVFQLGLLEVKAHVVDALPYPGGQCIELYADKPIYDIPSVRRCTGRELVDNLLDQIEPFDAPFHLDQLVSEVRRREDGGFDVTTSGGRRFDARTVIVAGGVGAFQPRRLKVEGLDAFDGGQLLHRLPDDAALAGQHVVIQGDTDAALEAAVHLAGLRLAAVPSGSRAGHHPGTGDSGTEKPGSGASGTRASGTGASGTGEPGTREPGIGWPGAEATGACMALPGGAPSSVTLVHRRDVFGADAALVERMRQLVAQGLMRLAIGQIEGIERSGERLTGLRLLTPDASTEVLPVDTLLVLLGLSPKLGPIADWGMAIERKQVVVDTASFETDIPGLYAVGDVNIYPGKKKLIVSGFHEATLAAHAVSARVHPQRHMPLQYTTTSPRLHELLGVGRLVR